MIMYDFVDCHVHTHAHTYTQRVCVCVSVSVCVCVMCVCVCVCMMCGDVGMPVYACVRMLDVCVSSI